MQPEQMRHVAVSGIYLLKLLRPFHQAPVRSDLGTGQLFSGCRDFIHKRIVDPQSFGGIETVAEQVPYDLLVHGRTHG